MGPAHETRLSWGVSGGQAMSCAAIERGVRWRRLQRAGAASVMSKRWRGHGLACHDDTASHRSFTQQEEVGDVMV